MRTGFWCSSYSHLITSSCSCSSAKLNIFSDLSRCFYDNFRLRSYSSSLAPESSITSSTILSFNVSARLPVPVPPPFRDEAFIEIFPARLFGASGGFPGVDRAGGAGDSTVSAAAVAGAIPASLDVGSVAPAARPRILSRRTSNLLYVFSCKCSSTYSDFFFACSSS